MKPHKKSIIVHKKIDFETESSECCMQYHKNAVIFFLVSEAADVFRNHHKNATHSHLSSQMFFSTGCPKNYRVENLNS